MTVYLCWTDAELPGSLRGPWVEWRIAGVGLVLVESDDTLSRVYHEIKWSLADGAALIVAPLAARPKLKALPPGTTSWLRDRLPPASGDA
ncbi:hypothetical protein [Nocardioides sp. R-C-SC26]|uniref:hypothetical protein n=1 Tax=Nocardioides sp. R-C-SC26 TaxID=2870414 RepID=UPI001E2FAAF8|nr:hypothetical protein [Nocardioides sp. R-C-SC26]